jgi:uncharacterized membrane protein YdjX (TVP38/TMEM64 family)
MEALQSLAGHVAHMGLPLFVAIYLLASMLPVPTWPLTVGAGAVLGFGEGLVLVLLTSSGGSIAAFLLARYALRRPVRKIVDEHPRVRSIDRALADGGWRAVALLQMSPAMPFGVQNYVLGASRVRLGPYVAGTVIGILPSATMYVLAGASGRRIANLSGPAKWALLAAGVVATFAFTAWMARLAKRRLAQG